ncbi:hypothetical protein SHIRM173S_07926 [Streptomyces hirsutus]
MTSSPARSVSTRTLTLFQVMLAWVRTAPLGRPVVPEVYMIMQGSSGVTRQFQGGGGGSGQEVLVGGAQGDQARRVRLPGRLAGRPPCGSAWIRILVPESVRLYASSGAVSRVLRGTKTAPRAPVANRVSRNVGWLGPR